MAAPLAALGDRFYFQRRMLAALVEGFGPEDWSRSAGGNDARWILGHIAASRRLLLRRLGEDLEEAEWEALYRRGVRPARGGSDPEPSLLLEDVHRSGKLLTTCLARLDEAALSDSFGARLPDGGTTRGDGAQFFQFHEAYHLGQIGLLRRLCGKPGVA
jgi:hypothetical protein